MANEVNQDPLQPRFREAFERLRPELRELPDGELYKLNLDAKEVSTAVLGALPRIRELKPELGRLLDFDMAHLERLESYALALGHAQVRYDAAIKRPPSPAKLAWRGSKQRHVLIAELTTLIDRGLVEPKVLSGLGRTKGYKTIGFDLLTLSDLLRANWPQVSGRTRIELQELNAVEILAEQLVTATGEREQGRCSAKDAARDRLAAYTLLMKAYDEVRSAIVYLRRNRGDADSIAPSLYAPLHPARKKAERSRK